ncbi:LLM class flavin-dependent oxidoreductase [bacterium]|nr:LLM class flavin-dependent oxidoreductase [bacterium]
MGTREDIKSLLAKEGFTLTKMAELMTLKMAKKYTLKDLSQKLKNDTLRYEEFKVMLDILGYTIEKK